MTLCRAYNNTDTSCIHLFRWSFSSIYLFMGPRLVSDMALNYIPGTEISIRQVHLVIPEICDNSTITVMSDIDKEENQWEPRVLLLNKLTTFVSKLAIMRGRVHGIRKLKWKPESGNGNWKTAMGNGKLIMHHNPGLSSYR